MTLFGYDQGVFSTSELFPPPHSCNSQRRTATAPLSVPHPLVMVPYRIRLLTYPFLSAGGVVINQNFLELHDLVGPSRTKVLSTVAAIYDIGCLLGAIVAFTIGERLGRKNGVLVGTTIMTIGAILQASSYSLAQMFIARIVLG